MISRRGLLLGVNLLVSVLLLAVVYVVKLRGLEWHGLFSVVLIYGLIVTPFLVFRLISAYLYKPVPDGGFRPKVSVVVPVFNEQENIGATVDAILNSDYPKNLLELVVVDDKSTDGTLEVIRKKQAVHDDFKLVALGVNAGKRHAMAAGVEHCTGDILVCIDSDTAVKPDAIRLIVQPFADSKVFGVCGNAAVINEFTPNKSLIAKFQKVWYAEAFRVRKGVESLFGTVFCCSGVLSAYRRDKFVSVIDEWLNEKFLGRKVISGDDRQMTNMMLRMGGKTVFQSNALAYTVAPHKLNKFVKQQTRWGRGSLRGMLFASSFFHKKQWKQKLLFYLTTFATYLSPFAFILSTVGLVVLGRPEAVLAYITGLVLVAAVFAVTDKLLVHYFSFKDILYRVGFFAVLIAVSFIYLYAWLTPQKGVWGTR